MESDNIKIIADYYSDSSRNLSILGRLRDEKYKYNVTTLKISGIGDNQKIILSKLSVLRNKGIEDNSEIRKKGTVNDCKLSEHICRARQTIFEYADNNPWNYFFTVTLDFSKYDRTNLKKFHKDFTQYILDLNKKYNTHINFLIIPEKHKDNKSWHFHGLFYKFPQELLQQFKLGDTMGKYIADKVKKGEIVYNCLSIQKKFGFCDFEPIKNNVAVSFYLTKYITKDLSKCVQDVGGHLYYCSRGLCKAVKLTQGVFNYEDLQTAPVSSFQSEYCLKQTFTYSDDLLNDLLNRFSNNN